MAYFHKRIFANTVKGREAMYANDSVEKLFFASKEIVADIINVVYGRGRTLVRPEDVEFHNTEYNIVWKDKDGKVISRRRIRDIMCEIKGVDLGGKKFTAHLGLECQSRQTSLMPFRAAEYDCMDLGGQRRRFENKRKRFIPCYTLVVNTSGRPWKEPTSLDVLYEPGPDFLGGHLLSYNMLLFDLFNIPPELEKLFCTDLKYVVHCISLMGDPARLLDYIMNELPKDLPEETINFICHIIGMEIPENCKIPRKEGETGMCYAVRVWRRAERKAGREEGRVEGREEGMEQKTCIVLKNALRMGFPQESIQSLLNISAEEYMRLLAL